jgi:hypothetical protein
MYSRTLVLFSHKCKLSRVRRKMWLTGLFFSVSELHRCAASCIHDPDLRLNCPASVDTGDFGIFVEGTRCPYVGDPFAVR